MVVSESRESVRFTSIQGRGLQEGRESTASCPSWVSRPACTCSTYTPSVTATQTPTNTQTPTQTGTPTNTPTPTATGVTAQLWNTNSDLWNNENQQWNLI